MEAPLSYERFEQRAVALESRVRAACERVGRKPESVKLMAVTKTHAAWAAEYAQRYGLACVGENRVQEAVSKKQERPQWHIHWELIGTLQTNKARLAVETFHRIQSVDRIKLVNALQRHCADIGRERLPILLQINAGNDPAKHGADPEEADALLQAALQADRLEVQGLMTIAPLSDDVEVARQTFRALRRIRDDMERRFGTPLPELSMGMTGDIEEAVEEGSTLVRVGTALFGSRD